MALTACASLPTKPASLSPAFPTIGPVFLDADTANEMDDLYAVAQVILDPEMDIAALGSAHFNNVEIGTKGRWHGYDVVADLDRGLNTVAASQAENEAILKMLGRMDIPHPRGAQEMIGYSWGYFDGADVPEAPAIDWIITLARQASPEQKADVALLGPLTHAAAALIQAPDIAPNLRVWWLGVEYDVETGVWNKNAFNGRNDLNALDYLLNRDDVELIMLPTTVAQELMFDRDRTFDQLSGIEHPLIEALLARWDFVGAGQSWIMWDMALTLAMAHPQWAEIATVAPPPENSRESLEVITAIEAEAMEAYFFDLMKGLASQ